MFSLPGFRFPTPRAGEQAPAGYELSVWTAAKNGEIVNLTNMCTDWAGNPVLNWANDDKYGQNACHAAADMIHPECLRVLIDAGADYKIAESTGWTALHYAAYQKGRSVESCRILVDEGASLSAVTEDGDTPLMVARKAGSVENVLFLEEAEAAAAKKAKKIKAEANRAFQATRAYNTPSARKALVRQGGGGGGGGEEEGEEDTEAVILMRKKFPSDCLLMAIAFLATYEAVCGFVLTANKKLCSWYKLQESVVYRNFLLRDVSDQQHLAESCFAGAAECLQIPEAGTTPSLRRLYQILRPFSGSLLGYYNIVPTMKLDASYDPSSSRGGLVCVRRSPTRLIVELVQPMSNRVHQAVLAFDAEQQCLCGVVEQAQNKPVPVLPTISGGLVISPYLHLEPLSPLVQVSKPDVLASAKNSLLAKLTGLYISNYGSGFHGYEIIQVSLIEAGCARSIKKGVREDGTQMEEYPLQLQGFKLTGDPNVPANKHTFCFNCTEEIRPEQIFQDDLRPIQVSMPSSVVLAALHADGAIASAGSEEQPDDYEEVVNFTDRLANIAFCFHGYGQVNSVVGKWEPRWSAAHLIVYKQPLANSTCFSLIWNEFSEHARYGSEFFSLPIAKQREVERDMLCWKPLVPDAWLVSMTNGSTGAANWISKKSGDILFHMNVRVEEGQIVMNSLLGGEWGGEERVAIPAAACEGGSTVSALFAVRLVPEGFKLSFKGQEIHVFNHRADADAFDKVECSSNGWKVQTPQQFKAEKAQGNAIPRAAGAAV